MAKLAEGIGGYMSARSEERMLKKRAKARLAEGNQGAREDRRQGELTTSRAQAVVASSGASMADPTIVNLMGDIDANSEYRALNRIYESQQEAAGLRDKARIRKREGQMKLLTSVMSTATSMADKYG